MTDEADSDDHDLPDDAVGGPVGVADDDAEVASDDGDVEPKWEEYAFEAGDVAVAAEILRGAAPDSTITEHDISNAVIRAAKHNPAVRSALEREIACAFMYRLKIDRSGSPTAGATLEPSTPGDQVHFLRAISELPADVCQLLDDLCAVLSVDRPLGRLHDILFVAKHGKVGDHGRAAIGHYLAVAPHADEHDRVEALLRAWTLARSMRRDDDERDARFAMWPLVRAHANQGNGGAPGVTLPLLEALTTVPRDRASLATEPDLDSVLTDLAGKYRVGHLVDRISGLQRRRAGANAAEVEKISRRRVQARLDEAEAATSAHLRMHHFEAAAALAGSLGVSDLADEAIKKMQNIKPDQLDWMHITASSHIPPQMLEGYLADFDCTGDWRDGIRRWLATPPPSGNYRDNVAAARDRLRENVLRHIFGSVTYGTHGLPQSSNATEDILDAEVRFGEQQNVRMFGDLLATALDRIWLLEPELAAVELTEWLIATYGADRALCYRLARSIVLFWERRYDESAHTAAPAAEAAARALLRELDEPLYKVEKGKTIGQFPGLGSLLPKLHTRGLDKSWQRYIEIVMLPGGYNLRNVLSHGLAPSLGRLDAVLILRAVALLVLVSPPDGTRRDESEVRALLASPISRPRRSARARVAAALRSARTEFGRRDL